MGLSIVRDKMRQLLSEPEHSPPTHGVVYALAAAGLFGASTR